MKIFILSVVLLIACTSATFKDKKMETSAHPQTIYEFKVPSIDGGTIDFEKYKGKKILVVNTAS